MTIAIDLTALADNFSGIERFTASIAYELIKQNQQDKYILVFKKEIFPIFMEFKDNDDVHFVIIKPCNKLLFSQIVLPLHLYRIKADYWLFMAFPTPLLFFRKGTITTIHDIGCWDQPETMTVQSRLFFRILYRIAAYRDKLILTVSEFSKNRIVDKLKISPAKVKVIYNGISAKPYAKDETKVQKIKEKYLLPTKYILCLSTLEPRKNLRLLIDACVDLWKSGELQSDLVLAGRKGWKTNNLLACLDNDVLEKIHFTGFIDEDDLSTVYHCAEVFIFPSLYEGFGIPPLEAITAGTKVISSNSSSLPEVLGDAAIYFENNDVTDLEDKLVAFFKGAYKLKNMELPRQYTWNNSAQKLRNWLKE